MGEKSADSDATGSSRLRRYAARRTSLPLLFATASVLVLLAIASDAGALTRVSLTSTTTWPSASPPPPSARASTGASNGPDSECNYTISLDGTTPVARGSPGSETIGFAGMDVGAFLNTLLASHETFCVSAGDYAVSSPIRIDHLEGVTLSLDPGAVMNASSNNIILVVYASLGTVIRGGEWIGPGRGQVSVIRIQYGSNNTVVEGTNVSKAGRDGIILYQDTGPSFNVSILNNTLHNNGRYGVQEYSNTSVGMWGTVISGNIALNNRAGGIYTNGAGGVTIIRNIVRNTVGNGPGEIGIGVTNGFNDTVTLNRVDHMAWYGIQAFYNNYTVISDNISTFNAGAWDQSGITSDHSSYSTIVGNLVESNGKLGIYVERSWNVTVSGNVASYNHGYGIAFYHGSIPTMGRSVVSGNVCSFNSLGGIILNSAIDNVISMNQCNNNSGYGIFLYNDLGNAGSTGNLLFNNSLGNEGSAPRTQTFGIGEANNSDNNTLISNVMVNNTEGAESLI